MLKNMFKKTYTKIDKPYKAEENSARKKMPADLWKKCNKCGRPIYVEDVYANQNICPKCGGYFRIGANQRIRLLTDEGTFEEWDREMELSNPLSFPGYEKKLLAAQEKSHLNEAIVTGCCKIGGYPAALGVCDARFLMSSMGHNMGEKITRMVERATREQLPVVIFSCSGGARMQEGMVSLMQMAKTSAALKRHHDAGQLFVSVLTDPTTGGVTASFAMLGDIILAEPGALIGFAGPRVIEQTIGQKLPDGFQRAEFLLEHGFIDKIVKREEMREILAEILRLHLVHAEKTLFSNRPIRPGNRSPLKASQLSAWELVKCSRSAERPVASDYIHALFDDFIEFHGDRYYRDDGAVIGGIASFHGMPVTVIGQEKGKTTKGNILRNFGMPSPEGYRKALRLMKQAEMFERPIICFVDTPGAFCGIEAEERGQGEAIARNLFEMSNLKVPILSIVIGEGGSGGALAMAVANEVWMMENSSYSILSPEGFASILWKDSKRAEEAARMMRITARELKDLGIVERIIPEEEPACAETLPALAQNMDYAITEFLAVWSFRTRDEIVQYRYERFRKY